MQMTELQEHPDARSDNQNGDLEGQLTFVFFNIIMSTLLLRFKN